jgi:hypothetical protein
MVSAVKERVYTHVLLFYGGFSSARHKNSRRKSELKEREVVKSGFASPVKH